MINFSFLYGTLGMWFLFVLCGWNVLDNYHLSIWNYNCGPPSTESYYYQSLKLKLKYCFMISSWCHSTDLVKRGKWFSNWVTGGMKWTGLNIALALFLNNYQLKTKQITGKCWFGPIITNHSWTQNFPTPFIDSSQWLCYRLQVSTL